MINQPLEQTTPPQVVKLLDEDWLAFWKICFNETNVLSSKLY